MWDNPIKSCAFIQTEDPEQDSMGEIRAVMERGHKHNSILTVSEHGGVLFTALSIKPF